MARSSTLAALSLATAGILSTFPIFWSLPTALLGGTAAAAGIALVNTLAERFKARGRAFLDLSVVHDNDAAIALLESRAVPGEQVFYDKFTTTGEQEGEDGQ